jgi:hypothetical protein
MHPRSPLPLLAHEAGLRDVGAVVLLTGPRPLRAITARTNRARRHVYRWGGQPA